MMSPMQNCNFIEKPLVRSPGTADTDTRNVPHRYRYSYFQVRLFLVRNESERLMNGLAFMFRTI